MLQIKKISKKYVTGSLVQEALDNVSFNLRDSEFVAVLGQSGSGKTTLMNIIGGLDHYDSGDIIINNISTKKYTDRDWDSYRNHTIGFVFQSYNLIPHQSILTNVELALTISGVSNSERKKRAKKVLEDVGLGDQLHKKPNQMSGGQMQRVAIARALVNDPDILLADEPTGALDSETSVQVMNLLQEVAKDRLVVMVTHNSELADQYANRIIKLHDGRIIDDSNPYKVDDSKMKEIKHKNMGKASMSFRTALSLSFNNLRTKKGRTILTSFAGSIGIIGIALILALSNGVNIYIESIQRDTMTSYPISIEAQSLDLNSMLAAGRQTSNSEVSHELDAIYSNSSDLELAQSAAASIKENNLTDFKKYLDNPDNEIHQYVGENGIIYSYDVKFNAYAYDPEGQIINTDGSDFTGNNSASSVTETQMSANGGNPLNNSASNGGMMGNMDMSGSDSSNLSEILPGSDGDLISGAVTDNYDIIHGDWPQAYDEVILVLDHNNEISTSALYELGFLPSSEYKEILEKIENGEEIEYVSHQWNYEDILEQSYYMLSVSDLYKENSSGVYEYVGDDNLEVEELLENSVKLKVVGVARLADDDSYASISGNIGYTRALTDYLIEQTNSSAVVKAQEEMSDINVLSGTAFDSENGDSYDDNMSSFGVVALDSPNAISIYADSFEDKDAISASIEDYNSTVGAENQISYTDLVGLLISSITTIINVITYILVAFVAISLIVSSIMIGIITFVSVIERTKEIGILRAIGASKRNISQIFNAETLIIGLISGLLGIGITLLLLVPVNAIIHVVLGTAAVNAALPFASAIVLILLSVILSIVAGLIPSGKAAKKDPVIALRSE